MKLFKQSSEQRNEKRLHDARLDRVGCLMDRNLAQISLIQSDLTDYLSTGSYDSKVVETYTRSIQNLTVAATALDNLYYEDSNFPFG